MGAFEMFSCAGSGQATVGHLSRADDLSVPWTITMLRRSPFVAEALARLTTNIILRPNGRSLSFGHTSGSAARWAGRFGSIYGERLIS